MDGWIAIPILALLIPVVLVPTKLGIKAWHRARDLEHAERMRALELGRTLPRDEPWLSPPKLALALGVVVPLGVFQAAGAATRSVGFHEPVWGLAAAVACTGVVSGAVLANKHYARQASWTPRDVKPSLVDADEYDVAGRRG